MIALILYLLAVICFLFAALGVKLGRIHLGWLGLMLFVLTFPVPKV